MGGFLGIGGCSAKTDRKAQLTGFGDLQNIFSWALPFAQSTSSTGLKTVGEGVDTLKGALGTLGGPLAYWKKLLSGNRAEVSGAVAPETNAVQAQADASKRSAGTFGTARTGGVAGANRTADTDTMAKIDNLLFGVRPQAAEGVSKIAGEEGAMGSAITSAGSAELSAALNALGIGTEAAGTLTGAAGKSRAESYAINRQTQQDWSNAIQGILKAFF